MSKYIIRAFDGNYSRETLTPATIIDLKALDSYYEKTVEAEFGELCGIFYSDPNLGSRGALIDELDS